MSSGDGTCFPSTTSPGPSVTSRNPDLAGALRGRQRQNPRLNSRYRILSLPTVAPSSVTENLQSVARLKRGRQAGWRSVVARRHPFVDGGQIEHPLVGSGCGKPRANSAGNLAWNSGMVRCRRRAAFSAGTSRGSTGKRMRFERSMAHQTGLKLPLG